MPPISLDSILATFRGPGERRHGGFGGSDGARAAEVQQGGAVSGEGAGDRAGTAPLGRAGRLPSQATLSRRVVAWSAAEGVEVLREGLQRLAG